MKPPEPQTEVPIDGLPLAVVDVETTGLSPSLHDRVIEIAIVRADAQGELTDEYATLVNPGRDLGPTDIHGISAEEILEAPTFEEIAGDVLERLRGAVFVAHNAQFDLRFVGAELTRLGIFLPAIPAVCTLKTAYRLQPGLANHQLATCCAAVGIEHARTHTALDDARATAMLMAAYLSAAKQQAWSLADLGCSPITFPMALWPRLAATGRVCLRRPKDAPLPVPYLARLVASLGPVAGNERLAPYLDLLDRALEDRRITDDEGQALHDTALEWGLTAEDLIAAHQSYLRSVVEAALADGFISETERKDLEAVAHMLGVGTPMLEALIERVAEQPRAHAGLAQSSLAGLTVCFTGKLLSSVGGEQVTRDDAHRFAEEAGLVVHNSVTKTLDLLVIADPYSQSSKARKAREYGTRVMAEAAFWQAINVRTD